MAAQKLYYYRSLTFIVNKKNTAEAIFTSCLVMSNSNQDEVGCELKLQQMFRLIVYHQHFPLHTATFTPRRYNTNLEPEQQTQYSAQSPCWLINKTVCDGGHLSSSQCVSFYEFPVLPALLSKFKVISLLWHL